MAKIQAPVIGRSKGSAGGMTFSKVYDKNVMKAKPFEVSNPNTVAQQTQRNFFKSVSAQVAGFSVEELRAIFPSKPKGISRRNAIFKQLAEFTQTVEGVKTMKLSDLVTIGNAPTMDMGVTTCTIAEGSISVGLSAALKANTDVKNFYFVAAVVNDTKNEIFVSGVNNKVETGTLTIPAPQGWSNDDTVHAIPLITDQTASFTGFGSMAILSRPERG